MTCYNGFKILTGGAMLALLLPVSVSARPHDHLFADGDLPEIKNLRVEQGMSSEAPLPPTHWIAQSQESAKKPGPPNKSGPPNNPNPPKKPGPPKPPGPVSPACP